MWCMRLRSGQKWVDDMTREEQREEIQKFVKSAKGKKLFKRIEEQLKRKLSRVEKQLIAIDLLDCIEINSGKVDELRSLGIEV